MAIVVSSTSVLDSILSGPELIVLDFFAQWCGPCKKISPVLQDLLEQSPKGKLVIVKVDVDDDPDNISVKYGIKLMPTFILIKNKKELAKIEGADEPLLRLTISQNI
jgi:thioredoxin